MSRTIFAVAAVVAGLLYLVLMPPPGFAADSCGGGCPKPPSNARSVSAQVVPLATYPGNTLSATLAKGKTKSILHAEGMLTQGGLGFAASRAYALVDCPRHYFPTLRVITRRARSIFARISSASFVHSNCVGVAL